MERLNITVIQCLYADVKDPAERKEFMIPEREELCGDALEKY